MIEIGGFTVSDESPSFIIAELSANHNHDKQIAIELNKRGFNLARRTISKYRKKLNIASSRNR